MFKCSFKIIYLFLFIVFGVFNISYSRNPIVQNTDTRRHIELSLFCIEKFEKSQPYFLKCENKYHDLRTKAHQILEANKVLQRSYYQEVDIQKKDQIRDQINLANKELDALLDEIFLFSENITKC